MMHMIRRVYDWMESKVGSPYADLWIVFLFFIESSVLLIPVDPLLILYCVARPKRSFYYAAITTAASVAGGVFGYMIGALMWKSVGIVLVKWLISEKTFYELVAKYRIYQNFAVFIAGFAPVPYKAVTISAGFCNLPLIPFIGYSILGRGGRFFLVAGAIRLWGDKIKLLIDKYFNYLVIAFLALVILSIKVVF